MEGPDQHAFAEICAAAVACNRCFPGLGVSRAFIDIAQPRYVGPGYWAAKERRLFLMINPGAGSGSPSDRAMHRELFAYRDGSMTLADLLRRQRARFPEWGRGGSFLRFFEHSRVSLDDIAMLNIAWCATEGNKYPSDMLRMCWKAYTERALAALSPTIVVACGNDAQTFLRQAGIPFVAAPHPSARFSFATFAGKLGPTAQEFAKETAAVVFEACVSALEEYAASRRDGATHRASRPADQDIIRLLRRDNPKTGLSKWRYDCYRDGMTVAKYRAEVARRLGEFEASKCREDLRWDEQRHFIRIEPR